MSVDTAIFQRQLEAILQDFAVMQGKSEFEDLSDLPKHDRQAIVTRAIASIHRIGGRESSYAKEVERLLAALPPLHKHTSSIMGVAKGLLDDLAAGHIKSLVEIVHCDIFGNFLEMAQHLCESGYKDAAAVIAGSTLESHLRGLCCKGLIPVVKAPGSTIPKKADTMNSDLASAGGRSRVATLQCQVRVLYTFVLCQMQHNRRRPTISSSVTFSTRVPLGLPWKT